MSRRSKRDYFPSTDTFPTCIRVSRGLSGRWRIDLDSRFFFSPFFLGFFFFFLFRVFGSVSALLCTKSRSISESPGGFVVSEKVQIRTRSLPLKSTENSVALARESEHRDLYRLNNNNIQTNEPIRALCAKTSCIPRILDKFAVSFFTENEIVIGA